MFTTSHSVYFHSSVKMKEIADESIDLVITSPPYPMIEMWDEIFAKMTPEIDSLFREAGGKQSSLSRQSAMRIFELMHTSLDRIWAECGRILKPGGFACINIGDAVRTLGGRFRLYSNHGRIIQAFEDLCFDTLPSIRWQKSTNAPNKFMGSGMLPAGAYVTLEYEFILIFRKGEKRLFTSPEDTRKRRESAFFWEERNIWFSDIWKIAGTRQDIIGNGRDKKMVEMRKRSGAYPWELPYRLILMYSLYGDTVVDPFAGTGSTSAAASAAGRNSIGFEIDRSFGPFIREKMRALEPALQARAGQRLDAHANYLLLQEQAGKAPKYINPYLGMPVKTRQEQEMRLYELIRFGEIDEDVSEQPNGTVRFMAEHRELRKR